MSTATQALDTIAELQFLESRINTVGFSRSNPRLYNSINEAGRGKIPSSPGIGNEPSPAIRCYRVDTITIAKAELEEQSLYLTLTRSSVEFQNKYIVQAVLTGDATFQHNGFDVFVGPGDMIVIDTSKPLAVKSTIGSTHTVAILPRELLERSLSTSDPHGMVFSQAKPTTRLLMEFLASLVENSSNLTNREAMAAQDALISLLVACLNSATECTEESTAINLSLRRRVLIYIDANLLNPALNPDMVRRELNISRSHLYRCFERDGGVMTLIRNKRLAFAHRLIVTNQGKRFTSKELAYMCGFNDGNQFTKAFKSFFNIHPKDAMVLAD
ncbi:helix-turn-helix domain-containing protein [Ochrobactrum vermis]|uniref:Helix-turn-helix domain-containing protein n=1 Tax=Ochrobactrum vermis TaxID=1827297 RepID=A0ABU8PK70_9HYPH|nr:helix-turn-helix domain-containing protein [Ochrobactrum vermis]